MKVLVWGLGYVGTVVSACLAEIGHEVIGIDVDHEKVDRFNQGYSPVKEPFVDDLISQSLKQGNLKAILGGREQVADADISLICVGTPSAPDGSPIYSYIHSVAEEIGLGLKGSSRYHVIVLRSTVFAGVTRTQLLPLIEKYSGLRAGRDFGLAVNPEFLRETTAVKDFYQPPHTIIGEYDQRSGDTVAALYQGVEGPIHRIGIEEAEILKVTNNAFHALKVGFANEIGRLCDPIDVNSHTIMELLCADTKLNISPKYLKPGFAFGGSCLPKDVRSLVFHSRRLGEDLPIMSALLPSNSLHIDAARLKVHDLGVRSVALLGISFKAGTDDLRESPVISLIRQLWRDGVSVQVYDPDVRLENILGSNRRYLERELPQVHQIMRDDLQQVLD
ncbi:MAG: nucleotide sugar dehydrogenase, partial [Phormidesmis sp.]